MAQILANMLRVAHGAAVMCGVALGICKLADLTNIDPVGRARYAASQLERDTVPADGRIVYRELTGYCLNDGSKTLAFRRIL